MMWSLDTALTRLGYCPSARWAWDGRVLTGRTTLFPLKPDLAAREYRHFVPAAFIPFSLLCFGFLLFLSFF
jgi:hypothetical protein